MIDTLVRLLPRAEARWPALRERFSIRHGSYGLVTLHRPSNVDEPEMLRGITEALEALAEVVPLIFPVHPRTRQRMASLGLELQQLRLAAPVGYLDFLALQRFAQVVITDSGGVQEESTYLGVPCLTVRENTERPVTVTEGTNIVIGRDTDRLRHEVAQILSGRPKEGRVPDLWDGRAGQRIATDVAERFLGSGRDVTVWLTNG